MKKIILMMAVLVSAVGLFAQQGPKPNVDPFGGPGGGEGRDDRRGGQFAPGGLAPGNFAAVEWKAGVSVLQEYKVLKGVLTIAKDQSVTIKADGLEYVVLLPRQAATQLSVKSGDTVNFEGVLTTTKGAGTIKPSFRVLRATVGGKVVDLQPQRGQGFFGGGDD